MLLLICSHQSEGSKALMIFKKAYYGNGRLAIVIFSEEGEREAVLTKNVELANPENYDEYTIFLDVNNCPEEYIAYLLENEYITTTGTGIKVNYVIYPIAIVDKDWLDSIEELQ